MDPLTTTLLNTLHPERRQPENEWKRAAMELHLVLKRIERRLGQNEVMCLLDGPELKPLLQMIRHSLEVVAPVLDRPKNSPEAVK